MENFNNCLNSRPISLPITSPTINIQKPKTSQTAKTKQPEPETSQPEATTKNIKKTTIQPTKNGAYTEQSSNAKGNTESNPASRNTTGIPQGQPLLKTKQDLKH